jgi:DNA topoisomerase-3
MMAKKVKVTKVNQKPTSKWRPLPLTTVDLQMMGSRFLRMNGAAIMKVFLFDLTHLCAVELSDLRNSDSRGSLH